MAALIFGGFVAHGNYSQHVGIDFYQYWGVGLGPQLSEGALKSPYVELSQYRDLLDFISNSSGDPRLRLVNAGNHYFNRDALDIPGTPLLYAMFKFMPSDYSLAYGIFWSVKVVLFVAAVVLFYSYKKTKWFLWLVAALVLERYYMPMANDYEVGNLGVFQLFYLAAMAFFLDTVIRSSSERRVLIWGPLFMSLLVVFVLIKPTILLAALFLSCSLWAMRGSRVFAISVIVAATIGFLAAIIPCVYFSSWAVWGDWGGYLQNDAQKTTYSVLKGNISIPLILSDIFDANLKVWQALVFLALFVHSLWTIYKAKPENISAFEYGKTRMIIWLKNPYISISLGVLITLAISPLVWFHYYVLALFPAFWLFSISPFWTRGELLSVLSIILSGMSSPFLEKYGAPLYWVNGVVICGWIPLWLGLQGVMAERSQSFGPKKHRP